MAVAKCMARRDMLVVCIEFCKVVCFNAFCQMQPSFTLCVWACDMTSHGWCLLASCSFVLLASVPFIQHLQAHACMPACVHCMLGYVMLPHLPRRTASGARLLGPGPLLRGARECPGGSMHCVSRWDVGTSKGVGIATCFGLALVRLAAKLRGAGIAGY